MFYICNMFSYFGEVSEVVNARIGSAWKKLKVLVGFVFALQQYGKPILN